MLFSYTHKKKKSPTVGGGQPPPTTLPYLITLLLHFAPPPPLTNLVTHCHWRSYGGTRAQPPPLIGESNKSFNVQKKAIWIHII